METKKKYDPRENKMSTSGRLQNVKHALLDLANRCENLAERLNVDGKPLGNRDKELIRMAQMPGFNEGLRMIKFGYVAEDKDMVDDGMKMLSEILE